MVRAVIAVRAEKVERSRARLRQAGCAADRAIHGQGVEELFVQVWFAPSTTSLLIVCAPEPLATVMPLPPLACRVRVLPPIVTELVAGVPRAGEVEAVDGEVRTQGIGQVGCAVGSEVNVAA